MMPGLRAAAVRVRDLARDLRNSLQLKSPFLAARRRGDIRDRIAGLEALFEAARDATVLDLGCFDGLIAYEFARSGARLVHGLDNDGYHLDTARRIFSQVGIASLFVHADLRKPDAVTRALGSECRRKYDIVLFLGVYQHVYRRMSAERRAALVAGIVDRAGTYLAIRVPQDVWGDLNRLLEPYQLELVSSVPQAGYVGELRLYRAKRIMQSDTII